MSYTHIATVTSDGSSSAIDFTSIPQVYSDLIMLTSLRQNGSATIRSIVLTVNGVGGTSYTERMIDSGNTSISSASNPNSSAIFWGLSNDTNSPINTFSNSEIWFANYSSTSVNKPIMLNSSAETMSSTNSNRINTALFTSNSAITSIRIATEGGNWVSGSKASLYGVNRIPTASLGATPAVDYLVVAGGGAGGYDRGGGGGAGGLLTGSAFSVASGTPITVTVGAGGTGQSSYTPGTSGGSSVFSSITTVGGGVGNWGGQGAGTSGGSGGGGGSGTASGTGGAGTAGQGFAGGSSGVNMGAGGGGGSGAVGETRTAVNGTGGAGGAGLPSTYSGLTKYYAGGGGGGAAMDFSSPIAGGAGGIGGGGAGGYGGGVGGANGLAGTGGGGGGGSNISQGKGGNGGSGVVIIRYPDTYTAPAAVTGNPMVTFINGYRVYTWTASGSITF